MKNVGIGITQADQDKKNLPAIASTSLQSKLGSSLTCRRSTEEPMQIFHTQGMLFEAPDGT